MLTKAKINEVLFKYYLERVKVMPFILEIILSSSRQEKQKAKVLVVGMLIKLLNSSRFLLYCLKQHNKTKGWIFSQITIVDFYFY